ncbi:ATP-binding cassette domain-containing protein [Pseudarthrobacter sp. MDT3-26]|uniref:ATP-binding cassette domain-containing protein n=1 Tax=Pseudarthrobacter raffinosi TaxID=2953651 RepID=UPI00208E5369|nr:MULTISPECIES: ATP-binding cassette domain-containing protein [unclassified Pseudarthrobacter]MCO4239689.1 ATP-binding cassette domain-containing protein [Pseudarthrobacter sp. MDT3-28]MCO4265268.1 ATP-binding cassette domain-containing protein [Pseudarthrobacter sp. MDT3-26]
MQPVATTSVKTRTDDVLAVKGLVKRYGERTVVDGVTFHIRAGETYGLLGPNGAGKTTIISMVAGLIPADAGSVIVVLIVQVGGQNSALFGQVRQTRTLTERVLQFVHGPGSGFAAGQFCGSFPPCNGDSAGHSRAGMGEPCCSEGDQSGEELPDVIVVVQDEVLKPGINTWACVAWLRPW